MTLSWSMPISMIVYQSVSFPAYGLPEFLIFPDTLSFGCGVVQPAVIVNDREPFYFIGKVSYVPGDQRKNPEYFPFLSEDLFNFLESLN